MLHFSRLYPFLLTRSLATGLLGIATFQVLFAANIEVPRFVKTIAYKSGSTQIEDQNAIERVAAWAKKYPNAVLRVEGYNCPQDLEGRKVDDPKTKTWLITVAERRANLIAEALGKKGIDRARIQTLALGMSDDDEAVKDGKNDQGQIRCKAQVVAIVKS